MLHQLPVSAVDDAAQALRDVDAMVLPHGFLSDLPSQQLFTDRWVCIVAASNGVALIQERLARQLTPAVPIRVLPCPFDVAPLMEALWWHPMYSRDAGHRWLLQLFTEAARSVHAGTD